MEYSEETSSKSRGMSNAKARRRKEMEMLKKKQWKLLMAKVQVQH